MTKLEELNAGRLNLDVKALRSAEFEPVDLQGDHCLARPIDASGSQRRSVVSLQHALRSEPPARDVVGVEILVVAEPSDALHLTDERSRH